MQRERLWTRRDFVKSCGVLTTGCLCGQKLMAADAAGALALESLHLRSWEIVEFPARKEKFRHFIKITADNGAVGYCRALGGVKGIGAPSRWLQGQTCWTMRTSTT